MSRARSGLVGGTVVTLVMTVLVLAPSVGIYAVHKIPGLIQDEGLDIPEDFEPFADRTIRTEVNIQTEGSQVSGYLLQALYTIEVGSGGDAMPLLEAVRRLAYCRGKDGIQLCADVPTSDAIAASIRTEMDEMFAHEGDGPRPYRVQISAQGEALVDVGGESMSSTFVFLKPIPGGQHARITLGFSTGDLSLGVESR